VERLSELVENLHLNMTNTTAEIIEQVVASCVPVGDQAVEKKKYNIPIFTEEPGPGPCTSGSTLQDESDKQPSKDIQIIPEEPGPGPYTRGLTSQESDELFSKYARFEVQDEYLDLMHASASHMVKEGEENDNWLV